MNQIELCTRMLSHCVMNNPHTENLTIGEIKQALEVFFDKKTIARAQAVLIGEARG